MLFWRQGVDKIRECEWEEKGLPTGHHSLTLLAERVRDTTESPGEIETPVELLSPHDPITLIVPEVAAGAVKNSLTVT